jgi:hypothetical protein
MGLIYKVRILLLVPDNFSPGRGVVPSLAERGEQCCTTSLECSVLKCGQTTQRTIHQTTLQDATFQTGSTHADKTAPPAPREMA